jgi:membrane-associated phospholipid phosphatase
MIGLEAVQNYFHPRRFSWARVVSDIVSPPIVWSVVVLPIALQYSRTTEQALVWSGIYGIFVSLLPILFVALMVWWGKIGDMHMQERRERFLPFLVSIFCTVIAIVILLVLNAPPVLPLIAVITLVNLTAIALITLAWQISMHAMSITSAIIAIGVVFSVGLALLFVPLAVLVGAARISLKRHTPAQVIGGTLLGALLPMIVLLVLASMLV